MKVSGLIFTGSGGDSKQLMGQILRFRNHIVWYLPNSKTSGQHIINLLNIGRAASPPTPLHWFRRPFFTLYIEVYTLDYGISVPGGTFGKTNKHAS